MGTILDSAEDIRQNKKNPSGKAHKTKEKLEKDKDKGVKMIPSIAKKLEGEILSDYVFIKKGDFKEEVHFRTTGGYFSLKTGITQRPTVLVTTEVPLSIQMHVAYEILQAKKYQKPTFIFPDTQQY